MESQKIKMARCRIGFLQCAIYHLKLLFEKFFLKTFPKRLDNNTIACYNKNIEKETQDQIKKEEPMKMKEFNYMEALESTITEQQFEVDELEAEISYLESSERKTETTHKMISELKQNLAEAVDNLRSAMKYIESQRQYA